MKGWMIVAGAATVLGLTMGSAQASVEIVKKARCVACHAVDKKLVGPSFQEVGAKYKGQSGAAAMLFEKVRNGGAGNWGQIPMTPNGPDKISDENLKAAVEWILSGAAAN
ncbi:MAG: c-type cytochrome [Zoogloeaceae bacterium]|nr:c-type cytochrome [Zoogloeaceae bacterium]